MKTKRYKGTPLKGSIGNAFPLMAMRGVVSSRSNITLPKDDYIYVNGCSFTYGTGLPLVGPQHDIRKTWSYYLSKRLGLGGGALDCVNSSFPGLGTDEIIRSVLELILTKDKEVLPSIIIIQLSSPYRLRLFNDDTGLWGENLLIDWELIRHMYITDKKTTKKPPSPLNTADISRVVLELYSDYQSLYNLITSLLLIKNKCDSLGIKFIVFDGLYQYNQVLDEQLGQRKHYYGLHSNEVLLNYLKDSHQNKIILRDLNKKLMDGGFFLYNGEKSWQDIIGDFNDDIPNEMRFVCGHPTEFAHKLMSNDLYDFIKNDSRS